ncbi:hypothetical protein RHSIM_Rhsim06G0118900 [Rhododendron simsii]|uniref:Uncharacterized protein n=1 Tax=Rhododendron simsii TaxID=118357 RepID=A0A834GWD1_RHOSS|nr:hypothetical protein RHSIM_Rhsim06G0118900 [Rhododendron simsii]
MEAQAVLAVATAAAAASLRTSLQRKDVPDEEVNLMKVNRSTRRPGLYSQQMPRAKETLSKLDVPLIVFYLDCYRSVKDSTGLWNCDLCEDLLSSRSSGAPVMNSWEKPYFSPNCCLCGGSAGALRKSTDGQWVHALCGEWVLEEHSKGDK